MVNFNWFKKMLLKEKPPAQEESVRRQPPSPAPARMESYPSVYGPRIIAVAGGKGGVGKSLLATNLAIMLSKQGRKSLLLDADLGAANLHTFLGIDGGRKALSGFLKDEITDLGSIVMRTSVPNLDLISGASDSLDVADVNAAKIQKLKECIKKLDYDYVVLDIGPGTSANQLDLFLMSSEGVVMATPEPTTIENNYRFLKCLFLRKIRSMADLQGDGRLKEMLARIFSDRWPQRVRTVADIIDQITKLDYEQGRLLIENIGRTKISMILNQTRTEKDMEIGATLEKACAEYFGVGVRFLGAIPYEETVNESIRKRKPLVIYYGESRAAEQIECCFKRLLGQTAINGQAATNFF